MIASGWVFLGTLCISTKNSSRLSDEVTGIFNLISDQTLPHLPVASSRTTLLVGQEGKTEFSPNINCTVLSSLLSLSLSLSLSFDTK
jgi:hypothetical protein